RRGTFTARDPDKLDATAPEPAANGAGLEPRKVAETEDSEPREHELEFIAVAVGAEAEHVERNPVEEFTLRRRRDDSRAAASRGQVRDFLDRGDSDGSFESDSARPLQKLIGDFVVYVTGRVYVAVRHLRAN